MPSFSVLGLVLGSFLGVGLVLVASSIPPREQSTEDQAHRPRRRGPLIVIQRLLEEAGHGNLDPLAFLALGVVGAVVIGGVVALFIPIPALSIVATGASVFLALGYVSRQKDARHQRLARAWPGVIDHVRSAIRSGSDVVTAITALPDSLPGEIVEPVEGFRQDVARGMATDTALAQLGQRLADPVGDRIVEVLRMAHEVGGTNLPSVLVELQRSVRSDIAVREDASAQQSWIRSAAALAVAAPWAVLLVIGTRSQTITAYQSTEGTMVLFVGALVSVIAYRMMKSIGALPKPRRWLV